MLSVFDPIPTNSSCITICNIFAIQEMDYSPGPLMSRGPGFFMG